MSEHDIQNEIMRWLKLEGLRVFRFNVGRRGHIRFGEPGMADILAFKESEFGAAYPESYWIEVKSETGKQSKEQKAFQKSVESIGCTYILARSLADVKAAI